jgi:hypothetical protein
MRGGQPGKRRKNGLLLRRLLIEQLQAPTGSPGLCGRIVWLCLQRELDAERHRPCYQLQHGYSGDQRPDPLLLHELIVRDAAVSGAYLDRSRASGVVHTPLCANESSRRSAAISFS